MTHAHLDHMGSTGLFDEVYMNLEDLPVYDYKTSTEHRLYDAHNRLKLQVSDISDLPPVYNKEFRSLIDGQCFELGEITIQMISVKDILQE